jgi:hypothetical protein
MIRPLALLFLATAALGAAASGCGSSTSGTGGGTATTSNSGSSGSSGKPATLDCTSYCTEVMANCTGNNAQYTGMDTCMGVCAGFPKGTLSDMSGDTLGCRIYHGGAAGGGAVAAATHCPHAGPTGGGKDPSGSGTCGAPCDAFCNVAQTVCTGANQQFTDMTACTTACKMFAPDTSTYNVSDTSTNDMGCRFYHLSAASGSTVLAAMHCPHIVVASPICTADAG